MRKAGGVDDLVDDMWCTFMLPMLQLVDMMLADAAGGMLKGETGD